MRSSIVLIIAACVAAIGWPGTHAATAQQRGHVVAISRVDTSAFPQVDVIAGVREASGRPTTGLTAEDFLLREDGSDVRDITFEQIVDRNTPLLIVIGLDTSGSMAGVKLSAAVRATNAITAGLAPHDRIALVTFANGVNPVIASAAPDIEAIDRVLSALRAQGSTALYDGAVAAVQTAAGSPLARKAVILVTDGRDEGDASISGRETALSLARDAGVSIYTVAIGDDADVAFLRELSVLSGGRAAAAVDAADLPALMSALSDELRSQYRLRYRTSVAADDAVHQIEVAVTAGGEQVRAEGTFTSVRVTPVVADAALDALDGDSGAPGTLTLEPAITSHDAITRVEYYLDAELVHTASSAPFRYVLTTSGLSRGGHNIEIRATDASGTTGTRSYAFKVAGTSFNYGYALLVAGIAAAGVGVAGYALRRRRRLDHRSLTSPQHLDTAAVDVTGVAVIAGPTITDTNGREYPVGGDGLTIGRADSCDIVIEADGRSVSREHARVECADGHCRVVDLSSVNGTRVNGRIVREATMDDGDVIEIGRARLRFSSGAMKADGLTAGAAPRS